VVAADVSTVLGEPDGVADLVQSWFGGIYSQIDQGIVTGSYVSRAMIWLIGAHAFLSAPLTGLGIGGTQSYFFTLDNAGFYIVSGAQQSDMVDGVAAAYSSPMVVRIPAEIGLLGTAYLSYYGWKAFKLVFDRGHENAELYYAYLYSLGAMLLSFCFAPEFFNPCITAFIAILAQTLRARQAYKSPAQPSATPALAAHLGTA
jgi:O-antigen ligase